MSSVTDIILLPWNRQALACGAIHDHRPGCLLLLAESSAESVALFRGGRVAAKSLCALRPGSWRESATLNESRLSSSSVQTGVGWC